MAMVFEQNPDFQGMLREVKVRWRLKMAGAVLALVPGIGVTR
jgi:ABC-type glycerol-3-phosphate transport system permease component